VAQLNDFLAQFKKKPFKVVEEGMLRTNFFTNTFSIAEDLIIVVKEESQIKTIARAAYPHGKKRRKAFQKNLEAQFREGNKRVSLRIVSPKVVDQQTNRVPRCDGPNCFNATLKWFYPEKELAETHPVEMNNYLMTHFKPIHPGEDLQFGDVLVWRNPQGELVHTSIYINEDFSWHKATFSESTSWVFERTMAINMMYGVDSKNHARLGAYRHKPRW
jgi:hypothetical protein